MSAKKNTKATASNDSMPSLKIGSRVRCTDDGVLGKITWANGVSVKIRWDDGEMVTWKRAELPSKPIEILPTDDEPRNEQPETATETTTAEAAPVMEQVATTEPTEPDAATATTTNEQEVSAEAQTMDAAAIAIPEQSAETPATESADRPRSTRRIPRRQRWASTPPSRRPPPSPNVSARRRHPPSQRRRRCPPSTPLPAFWSRRART